MNAIALYYGKGVNLLIKDLMYSDFQNTVSEMVLYNRSILDLLSKTQEASARVQRAITTSVTLCGCVKIEARKKNIPPDACLADLKDLLESHLQGEMCDSCRENVEREIGQVLFYLAAISNILKIDLYDVVIKEHKQLTLLGRFNMA